MNRLLFSAAWAVSMILVALATVQGAIPADTGEVLLLAMPALAIASMRPMKGCKLGKGVCA